MKKTFDTEKKLYTLSQLVQDLFKDPVVFKLDQAVALVHNAHDRSL